MLFHVIAEIHLPPSFSLGMHLPNIKSTGEYLKTLYGMIKSDAMELLNRKKKEIIEKGVGNVRTKVSVGHPAEQILALAKAEKADLIIIGSVGRTGIAKLKTLGSVSRSISEGAPCPVMIVH
jgi:nucleotide-binding universal stress UspA family protein